jgi:hypothetical protein
LYLRLYEFLCGFVALAAVIYFTRAFEVPPDLRGSPRLVFALVGPLSFIFFYYILFKYLLVALLTTFALGITPFFRRTTLAAVNAMTYAVHGLWVIHLAPNGWPPPIWAAWAIIVVYDGISPFLLPSRLFTQGE